MNLTDAELLNIVRVLRLHMASMDNCHTAIENLNRISEEQISTTAKLFSNEIRETNLKISKLLKLVEGSKSYRDMLKNFNMKEEPTKNEEDDDQWL